MAYEWWLQYSLFFAQTLTILVSVIAVFLVLANLFGRRRHSADRIEVKRINDRYEAMEHAIKSELLDDRAWKAWLKALKKKGHDDTPRRRIFVVDFSGDVHANEVDNLREEITAVLTVATQNDEVFVRLESPGGVVHGYGLGASQLARVRKRGIPLTVAVDKIAASGGYMMACVANKIIAAPFAIVGSVGVLAQVPNFNRLLKKHDVDYEEFTAGEFKTTVTMFGENTPQSRAKFQQEIEDTHELFKNFVVENRPGVDIVKVATGEHWHGTQSVDLHLVDELTTSDDYLFEASKKADIVQIIYTHKAMWMPRWAGYFQDAAKAWLLKKLAK